MMRDRTGIFYLVDDCDTLICKLENRLNELYIARKFDIERIDRLEKDLEELKTAMRENNKVILQQMLDRYHILFKRYS